MNKRGADRVDIETMEYDPQDYEFDSDDFDGVVVLTVEEALGIAMAMNPTPDDAHIKEWLIKRIGEVESMK